MITIGSISSSSDVYKQKFSQIEKLYRIGKLATLCGAGISFGYPSLLPGGQQIRESIVYSLLQSFTEYKLDLDVKNLKTILESRPIEQLIDSLYKVYGNKALDFLVPLDSSRWNPNHYYLANLLYLDNRFKVITLNFDILIETALDTLDCSYNVYCPLSTSLSKKTAQNTQINILKPHGSILLPGEVGQRLNNITTTLSEIGDMPDKRTIKLFDGIFLKSSLLIIAGYRGEDWDILPIVKRMMLQYSKLEIIWIVYYDPNKIDSIEDGKILELSEPIDGVISFLQEFSNRTTILYGDVQFLYYHLYEKILSAKSQVKPITEHHPFLELNNNLFFNNKFATMLALIDIVQDLHRNSANILLEFISKRKELLLNNHLLQYYYNLQAWQYYVNRKLELGIQFKRKAIRINLKSGLKKKPELSSDFVSTGYQCISFGKPRLFKLREIPLVFYYVFLGMRYLSKGEHLGNYKNKAYAAYYKADFVHTWALISLLPGNNWFVLIRKMIFRFVVLQYNKVEKRYTDHMQREYFYLRYLEANVFAGSITLKNSIKEINKRLEEIASYFAITKQLEHLRNLCVTYALLKFAEDPNDNEILLYMKCALLESSNQNRIDDSIRIFAKKKDFVKSLIEIIENSSGVTTLTDSAIRRYNLFLRFLYPKKYKLSIALKSKNLFEMI